MFKKLKRDSVQYLIKFIYCIKTKKKKKIILKNDHGTLKTDEDKNKLKIFYQLLH